MYGIYKITNKLNGKSYIGQSVHCGKRLDEHARGKEQFIDLTIQLEGIENFSLDLLKECNKSEMSYWEDYYIKMYNTHFPNGYNMKWNTSQEIRDTMKVTPVVTQKPARQEVSAQDNRTIDQLMRDERKSFEIDFKKKCEESIRHNGDDRMCYDCKYHLPKMFEEFKKMCKLYFDYDLLCDHTIVEAIEYLEFSETALKLACKQLTASGWMGDKKYFYKAGKEMAMIALKVINSGDENLYAEILPRYGYSDLDLYEKSYQYFPCELTPKGRVRQRHEWNLKNLQKYYHIYTDYNILYGGTVVASKEGIKVCLYLFPPESEKEILRGEELRSAINNAFETYWYKHQGIV